MVLWTFLPSICRSGDCIGLQCVDNHPTQPHIVATGGQDGTLCIWDMRQDRFPVTLLDAHSAHSNILYFDGIMILSFWFR